MAVLRDLPPGESLTARELHARMTDRFGYQLTAETVRKVAQRMVGRHTLVKSDQARGNSRNSGRRPG